MFPCTTLLSNRLPLLETLLKVRVRVRVNITIGVSVKVNAEVKVKVNVRVWVTVTVNVRASVIPLHHVAEQPIGAAGDTAQGWG